MALNPMIAEKVNSIDFIKCSVLNQCCILQVSWLKVPFLMGLYISSLSSILGSLYGAPRILQSIASENVIPFMKRLEAGVSLLNIIFLMHYYYVLYFIREVRTKSQY